MRDKKNYTSYRIGVKNFGPLKEAEIDLRPLTIFVGKSNTGKSYLAILIYALLCSLEDAPLFPAPVKTKRYLLSLLHILRGNEGESFKLKLMNILKNADKQIRFSELPDSIKESIEQWRNESEGFSQDLSDQLMRAFNVPRIAELAKSSSNPAGLEISITAEKNKNLLWNVKAKGKSRSFESDIQVNSFTIDAPLGRKKRVAASPLRFESDLDDLLSSKINAIHYLPAARSGIVEAYRPLMQAMVAHAGRAGLGRQIRQPTLPGGIVNFLQSIISYFEGRQEDFFDPHWGRRVSSKLMEEIALKMEEEVLRGKITVRKDKMTNYPHFYYTFKKATGGKPKEIDLHLASSMVSELTPIVLYLKRYVYPGDILIIEEPEAHLHPEGQKELTKTFARLVNAGVYLIITTHSEWLKEAIGVHIFDSLSGKPENYKKDTALSQKDVGVWLFERTSSQGSTVSEIEFDGGFGFAQHEYEQVAEELHNHFAEIQNEPARRRG